MKDLTTFNTVASNGKVLSPVGQDYLNTPLPQEVIDYVTENTSVIDGQDYIDNRYNFDDFASTEDDTFSALYYAFASKGKLNRLSIDYVNMLNHDGLGPDNQTQWKRATVLKSAIDAKAQLAKHLDSALDELEEHSHLSDTTITDLVHLSVTTGHINTALTQELADFVKRCPDLDYESGKKDRHFLFEAGNSRGGDFHLADLRHGEAEDQIALVSEGARLARTNRYALPELKDAPRNQLSIQREISFDDLVKTSIWGKKSLEEDTSPDEPPPEP